MKEYRNSQQQLHRLDGPACEYPDGTSAWYFNGLLHRTDGPACEYTTGARYWYQLGQRHRLDGPACEYPDGTSAWFYQDQLHRTNGPAVKRSDGTVGWYIHGQDITTQVETWLAQTHYTWPFDPDVQAEFILRFFTQ